MINSVSAVDVSPSPRTGLAIFILEVGVHKWRVGREIRLLQGQVHKKVKELSGLCVLLEWSHRN